MKKQLHIQKTLKPLERMPINEWYQYIHDQVHMNENPSYYREKARSQLNETISEINDSLDAHCNRLAEILNVYNKQDALVGEAYKVLRHGK